MTLRTRCLHLATVSLLGAALLATYRLRPPVLPKDPQVEALETEESSLLKFDRAMIGKLRSDREVLARQVTAPPLDVLKSTLGQRWAWSALDDDRYAVTCSGEPAADWPALLASLVALERQPGVFLESAALHGDGRQLTRTQLTVRIRSPRILPSPAPQPQPPNPS